MIVLLIVLCALGFSNCGNQTTAEQSSSAETVVTTTDANSSSRTVIITANRKKCHKKVHGDWTVIGEIPESQAVAQGYEPCKTCCK